MKQGVFTITENAPLTGAVYRLRLAGDTSAVTAPGQFVNVALPGLYLRRPISVSDASDGQLTLIYKVVGKGTEAMAAMMPGQTLDVLSGLGNGFDVSLAGDAPLLLGGGIGAAPLVLLARRLRAAGKAVSVVLGFNTRDEIFYEDEFRALGCDVTVATADGSCGVPGFVTDALPEEYSFYYACGPEPMLRAVYDRAAGDGQLSFEARMGCGFGACMGCTRQTAAGPKRVCKDGPVFRKGEILWDA